MIPYSHVFLFSGLTNCKYTLPYLISTVEIGRQKKADGSENEQPDYPSLSLSPHLVRLSQLSRGTCSKSPLISNLRSGTSGSVSEMSGATGKIRAG